MKHQLANTTCGRIVIHQSPSTGACSSEDQRLWRFAALTHSSSPGSRQTRKPKDWWSCAPYREAMILLEVGGLRHPGQVHPFFHHRTCNCRHSPTLSRHGLTTQSTSATIDLASTPARTHEQLGNPRNTITPTQRRTSARCRRRHFTLVESNPLADGTHQTLRHHHLKQKYSSTRRHCKVNSTTVCATSGKP